MQTLHFINYAQIWTKMPGIGLNSPAGISAAYLATFDNISQKPEDGLTSSVAQMAARSDYSTLEQLLQRPYEIVIKLTDSKRTGYIVAGYHHSSEPSMENGLKKFYRAATVDG